MTSLQGNRKGLFSTGCVEELQKDYLNMNKLLLFVGIMGIVLACGNAESPAQETAEAKPDGEKIYKQYCIACHGLYGDMGASGAFNLQTSQLSLEERILVITSGRNAMTPFEALLDEKEIKAVAKYTMKLSKQ